MAGLAKQTHFFPELGLKKNEAKTHGGRSAIGRRKSRRPFAPGKAIHLVLRSEKARGDFSFLKSRNLLAVKKTLDRQAKKWGVKIGAYANVGNHLHLQVRAGSRKGFQAFLKSSTALIARQVTGAKRGAKLRGPENSAGRKFWDALAYTRVLTSRLEEATLARYITANQLEAKFGERGRALVLQNRPWLDKLLKQRQAGFDRILANPSWETNSIPT